MPKVSILVPICNVEPYLRECLDSITAQTLQDIEIICINDGSTDNSLGIIEEYASKDNRIHIINKSNSGYGHSMNIGLDMASGEFIGIVESDDFIATDMFEKLVALADKYQVEVVKSNYYEYRSKSQTIDFMETLKNCKYETVFSPMDDMNTFFIQPSIWSGLFRRDFLIKNEVRFLETPGASYQDTSFAFKVWFSAEKVYLTKEAFLRYRVDNLGSSVNSSAKVFCISDEFKEIERFASENVAKSNRIASVISAMKFRAYLWNYHRLAADFQYAFLLRMKGQFQSAIQQENVNKQFLNAFECESVKKVISDPEKFFKESAKGQRDTYSSVILNSQFFRLGFWTALGQYKGIIIYGAGMFGKRIAQHLQDEGKWDKVICFAVTNQLNNPEELLERPVRPVHQLTAYSDDHVVLVAIKEREQLEIIQQLESMQFKNIISVDANLLNAL